MNLTATTSQNQTISSREIESRHDNVKRSIDSLEGRGFNKCFVVLDESPYTKAVTESSLAISSGMTERLPVRD